MDNSKYLSIFLIVSLFLFPPNVSAQGQSQRVILDNGLTVLIHEIPSIATVAINALVKTGSATEGKYVGTGISHLVEHMLFKGTQKRGPGVISSEIGALGGRINASTSFDYTMYNIELPSENLSQALDVMADLLMNSVFERDQVEKEREVIFGEIRLREDRPGSYLSQLVFRTVYHRHPYRHPIIGYRAFLKEISRDDLVDYYNTHYAPNNMVLSIAGGINADNALKEIKAAFGGFKPRPHLDRNLPEEPPQLAQRRYEEEYPTQLTRLSLNFPTVDVLSPDLFALDVLAMLLGQGQSSRLYVDVYKQKGLVHSIHASNYTPFDKGIFSVDCVLDEANAEPVIKEIKRQIDLIKRGGVSAKELAKTKRQALADYIFSQQSAGGLSAHSALDEYLTGDYQFSKLYLDGIRSVTVEDIMRVAKDYLNDQQSTVVILKPKKTSPITSFGAKDIKEAETQKFSLPNGMTVLLREDHSFPLVAVTLALQGGTRAENADYNGISKLTSQLLTKGTSKRSAESLAEYVESRGMTLSAFSGNNSFGLTMNLLSEDVEDALDLVHEIIRKPAFRQKEFDKLKDNFKSAITARKDSIFDMAGKSLRETLFLKHPLRFDPLGTKKSIPNISRQETVDFYKTYVAPNNMVLSVSGDIDLEDVWYVIKHRFSNLRSQDVSLPAFTEEPPTITRHNILNLDKQQACVMIGFQAPSIREADRYPMEVLTSILGSSLQGRIFNKIRDELGQAYTLGGYYTPAVDMGMVKFFVMTTNEHLERVKNILLNEIETVRFEDVTDEELARTKTYLKGLQQMRLETNADFSFDSAIHELYGLGFNHRDTYTPEIDQVTKADLRRIAEFYFAKNKAAIVTAASTTPPIAK